MDIVNGDDILTTNDRKDKGCIHKLIGIVW